MKYTGDVQELQRQLLSANQLKQNISICRAHARQVFSNILT